MRGSSETLLFCITSCNWHFLQIWIKKLTILISYSKQLISEIWFKKNLASTCNNVFPQALSARFALYNSSGGRETSCQSSCSDDSFACPTGLRDGAGLWFWICHVPCLSTRYSRGNAAVSHSGAAAGSPKEDAHLQKSEKIIIKFKKLQTFMSRLLELHWSDIFYAKVNNTQSKKSFTN